MSQKEAKARIKINKLLSESGWRFFDDETGPANIALENNVKITQNKIDELGENFEKLSNGFVDFLLLDTEGFPLVVLEAKAEECSPLDGKEQARRYAQSLNVRFIILSNGNIHYLWDIESGNPEIISAFPNAESIKHKKTFKPDPVKLADESVESDYVALTQNRNYQLDPSWLDEAEKKSFIENAGLKFFRPYQLQAIKAVQESARKGNTRYLLEMATGTGKTLVSAGLIKLFLKTGNAKRVLFLVDRIELENQAWKAFVKYLKNDYTCVIYKDHKDDWRKAEIVVTTVQSLAVDSKYKQLFSPADFDFIVSDEAHRSISGNSRAVFEYFMGYKLGLTATPKDYLKNVGKQINENDPREWERRQLLDTYETFGCKSGNPTFRYSLLDGVSDGFLINPIVTDARTEITTDLLSEKGYSTMFVDSEGNEEEKTFYQRDFERKFFSEKTNSIFCKTFLENALRDPLSGEMGKSIVFCVSQNHASKVTQILNQMADQLYPGKYNSDFAIQVTSNIRDSQEFTINFANNNLSGFTSFLNGYKSSKTRVCVTVGMMTTGYDCEDILNLCLMRPIFSPADFVQIKGRGTRGFTFSYTQKVEGQVEATTVKKENFKLFDFFANCEYFEEKFNYDEVLKLPQVTTSTGTGGGGVDIDKLTIDKIDPLKTLNEKAVGLQGMKVDRKLFDKFEETIKTNPDLQKSYQQGDIESIEKFITAEVFDKPQEFINLDKLRSSVRADRRISLQEIIHKIFGGIDRFKTKDELLENEYEKFISIYKPESKYAMPIKNFLKAYITDSEIRDVMEKKDYGRLATNPKLNLADLKELNGYRDTIPEYVKDYVPLNKFM